MIDTHCHLYVEEFESDLDDTFQRAKNQGIEQIWLPAIDSNYHLAMFDLKEKYPNEIQLMIGLHPSYVKPESFENELKIVENQLKINNFIAIGEIGIDLHWDKTTLPIQIIAFQQQIKWAKQRNLPICIHGRESFDEIFNVLEQEKSNNLFGIFHCFSGDLNQAKQAIGYNLKLGIGGVSTFKNGKIDQFLNEIPLENIVLETDSPYLAPVPNRGKRNEPSYLTFITQKLSEIYDFPIEKIKEITTENAKSLLK